MKHGCLSPANAYAHRKTFEFDVYCFRLCYITLFAWTFCICTSTISVENARNTR